MRGAVLYGPRDVRFEERATPAIVEPTDVVISLSATCCRSSRSPKATVRWTSAEQSRHSSSRRTSFHEKESTMRRSVARVLAGLCLAAILGSPMNISGRRSAPVQDARQRFVGSWRLVPLEHAGPDGKAEKPDCVGQFVFTADGGAAVQVMYRNAGAGDQYAQAGYEATFGRYTVDDQARTFTFHVDGALVRTLVGKDLRRNFTFAGDQLIVEPSNKDEHWRVVWTRK